MRSLLRAILAAPKRLYFDPITSKEFDLAYISPKVIVCSGPVNDFFRSIYRYKLEDLLVILSCNHGDNWHIWNFIREEPGYIEEDVQGKVSYYPFRDRQSPSVDLLILSIQEISEYIERNPSGVAVLHCKAGKGRSGTICCAYLMYSEFINGREMSSQEAIKVFTERRMRKFSGNAVSILSQVRYLNYWHIFLKSLPERRNALIGRFQINYQKSTITSIKFYGLNSTLGKKSKRKFSLLCYDMFDEQHRKQDIYTIYAAYLEASSRSGGYSESIPRKHISLESIKDMRFSIDEWPYAWFNIYFETFKKAEYTKGMKGINEKVAFSWDDLDGFKGSDIKGKKLFERVEICWHLHFES